MDISNRRVLMFRCHVAQHVGPKMMNAIVPKDMGASAEIAYCKEGPVGIYLKLPQGQEHVFGFNNIESMILEKESNLEAPIELEKRRPGRPASI